MKRSTFVLTCLIVISLLWIRCGAPLKIATEPIQLIVRGDDMGRTHSSNLAFKKSFQEGILTCASIMVPSPWFEEAARMCRENPEWCIGVHLTLNAEWRDYRWKPILPVNEVRSLVDEDGYFYPTTEGFLDANPDLEEVDKELRAQVDLALKRKIDVQYIDTHMDTARATPELREIVLKIRQDYNLPLSRESGEKQLSIYEIPPNQKGKALADELRNLDSGLWLLVVHPGLDTLEERALIDANPEGLPNVAENRAAVTKALTDKRIKKIIKKRGIQLIDYRGLRPQLPLSDSHK
ncbi:MAG: ChbG/HpnK family deacetylase [Candidatus Aenigmarchaeota archaeon]|nr:ChbG/HpnK family deacetylase [Candidatus Aenigmarchaeota archaeon]